MIKIGILGYGYMGEIRKRYFDQDKNCKVTKIFHTSPVNGDFEFVDSWENIVTDDGIDAVIVCLPNYLIKKAVIESLKNGKHVFAEKPPGISALEVEEMMKFEQRTKLKLKFGFNHRYHPAIIKAKELVNSGKFGNILWVRGRYGKSVDKDFKNNWRSEKKYAGGGILMDQGIHMLDLMLHFCENFDEVKAFASNLYWKGDIEDNVFALLRNKRGQVASLHSTMTQWRYLFALEIFLSNGYIVINGLLSKSGRYGQEKLDFSINKEASPVAVHSDVTSITFNTDNSWKLETDEFVSAILDNSEIRIGNTKDALKLMILLEKIYEDSGIINSI